jgi:hypothetical protein
MKRQRYSYADTIGQNNIPFTDVLQNGKTK